MEEETGRMSSPGVIVAIAMLMILMISKTTAIAAPAVTATIGGAIYTGQKIGGQPDYATAPPLPGAKVMVQNQHSGGAFITYATVTGNAWTAQVPAPGDYVVMFSAPGHDATSREFTVTAGDNLSGNAYLPPLPLPLANLLVYTFMDDYVNGEDDFPADPPLNGVTITVKDEDGNVLAQGLSGSQGTITTADGIVINPANGYYYFTGLPPGKVVVSSDPSTAWQGNNPGLGIGATTEYYLTTSEEGGHTWEPSLYPGDPGTAAGGYLIWHGYVKKLGQIGDPTNPNSTNPAIAGSISGVLLDADGNDPAQPFPPNLPYISPNGAVPEGVLVLVASNAAGKVRPVATTETDPVSGMFRFNNVFPGNYKIFATDKPIDYVWGQRQVKVAPRTDWPVNIMLPRFFARVQGYVTDRSTGLAIPGAQVNMRFKDGSIWKSVVADANGWYNFDDIPEIEVIGAVDVNLPDNTAYRHAITDFDPDGAGALPPVSSNAATRLIQWYTFNYRADLALEQVPANTGDINGFVFYDHLTPGAWTADGIHQNEERTLHGLTVNLYDATGTVLLATTATGQFDESGTLAQGWHRPYTWPPDEFGGVYAGELTGFYEFRDLAPGNYQVEITPPTGFQRSPELPLMTPVTVSGGRIRKVDMGLNTRPVVGDPVGVPLAGEIEGGLFDDLNLDGNPLSLLFMEKAGLPGAPVGVYDHLGYRLGAGYMGNPLCYTGSAVCPPGEPLGQKPEMARRFAPGVHIYYGNDPSLPGHNPNYLPVALSYQFGQGKFKFEADWSHVPVAFGGLGGAMLANGPVLPANAPVITFAGPGGSYLIYGHNFGDKRGYSTVTLSGRRLKVKSWSDTEIHVKESPHKDVSGPIIVATSTGISNAGHIDVNYGSRRARYMARRSVYVGPGQQYASIAEALNHLPEARPRYVFVAPGTYKERIRIKESDIYIIGSGPLETTIDGLPEQSFIASQGFSNGGGPVVSIGEGGENGSVRNVMISGFTIKGGTVKNDKGAGIFGDYGNRKININNCIIKHNGGSYGGGIWLHSSNHNVKIWSNIIADNGNVGGYGGGISVNDEPAYGPVRGEPEHLWDDHFPGPPPGVYRIFNNLIFHNFSPDYGGGISLYEVKDHLRIYGNVIMENKSDDHGGGIFFEDTGPVNVFGNVFLRNYCTDDGGAISFEDVGDDTAIVKVYNNLFAENIADDRGENNARGGALAFEDTFHAKVYNNTIVGNIVAGSIDPAGGGIDSERNGHEYSGNCPLCPDIAPGYSDPEIYNNIIWNNWRLHYDQPGGAEGTLDYSRGVNRQWNPDQLHVDNPNLQGEWYSQMNSESFTAVDHNDILGGSYADRDGNMDVDPWFANPLNFDWRLSDGSPAINMAPAITAPRKDLENLVRRSGDGMVETGAYEHRQIQYGAVRIPTGILGAIHVPVPGS